MGNWCDYQCKYRRKVLKSKMKMEFVIGPTYILPTGGTRFLMTELIERTHILEPM